jgi:hypothetical protein
VAILDAFGVVGGEEANGRVGIGGAKVDLAAEKFWILPKCVWGRRQGGAKVDLDFS